jgi:hypothetical protein
VIEDERYRDDAAVELFEVERDQKVFFVLYVVLSVALWAQWLGGAVVTEVSSEDGTGGVLALYLLPLGAAALAVLWRHEAMPLVVVPASFLPGFLVLPEGEWGRLGEPGSLVASGVLFAVYLVVAAGRPRSDELVGLPRRELEEELERSDQYSEAFRGFVAVRMVVMAALFCVITYALLLSPPIQESFAALGEGGEAQRVFTAVLLYFGWSIAVYMAAVLPALNWEHDRRQSVLSVRERRLLKSGARLRRRVFVEVAAVVVVFLGIFWMTI